MKFATAAILSAAVASADVIFNVSDFSAGCVAHGTECLYDFKVIQPGTMETTPVSCTASALSNDGTLPAVTSGKCVGSSRTFTIKPSAAGLVLAVSQQVTPASFTIGSHVLAKSDIKSTTSGASTVENYTGATAFSLTD
ncbi:glycoprotein [Grosmannia clavigera kw1407]|uniref:Glycoprotein n=1 Tax=Grosmannia clavigera (strain kw1407 / UAMH 11150) TaxID=655863 RepID=F0XEU3_GROCL|nr:glycoprotein [Grosmannia clavigera kw1407]EFX03806.1 glycoprotein [Grosmannia clavigera kw1407]